MLDKNIKQPLVSILTPTWNRADYLEKVWNGIVDQDYKNVEWIVGNDGSIDDTFEVIKSLAKKSTFPVRLIDSNIRIGKSRIDNLLMRNANGELLIWNDSDDFLLPSALSTLVKAWLNIPENRRENYLGVIAQCISTENIIQGENFDKQLNIVDETYEEFSLKTSGDAALLVPSKSIAGKMFLEVDFVITESSFWSTIFKDKRLIYIPQVLKVMDRKAPGSVSFGKKLQYTRGMAYGIAFAETQDRFAKRNFRVKCKLIIRYWRYCFHGELGLIDAKNMWVITRMNLLLLMFYPISLLFVIKDIAFRKVEKTHRDFDAAKLNAKVRIYQF
jgi:glycosyltransferase involved in cell wall biosynthesis